VKPMRATSFHRYSLVLIGYARWWFGLTYAVAGVGMLIGGPIMIARGDYGGIYAMLGGCIIAALGWIVHPWGLTRARRELPTLAQE